MINYSCPDKSVEKCSTYWVENNQLQSIGILLGWGHVFSTREFVTIHFVRWEEIEKDKANKRNYKILKTIVASKEDMVKNNWVLEFP